MVTQIIPKVVKLMLSKEKIIKTDFSTSKNFTFFGPMEMCFQ